MQQLKKPLTKAGQKRLAEEHHQLAFVRRPQVVEGIARAAADGDRSENAEYIYGKKLLREIDKRLRYLHNLLDGAQIIDPGVLSGDKVCFGSTVTVTDENEVVKKWTIVGDGETDGSGDQISWHSPVAKALLGKKVGDQVTVKRPKGEIDLEISDLEFAGRSWKKP